MTLPGEPKRPWGPTAPAGPWDAVVVGAGMGGLSAAATLSRVGQRVLVLEQHRVPGGYTQSFRRGPWSWDVGLHVVGEVGPQHFAGRLLHALARGQVAWTKVRGPYDVVELAGGEVIPVPASLAAYRDSLCTAFPGEAEAIGRYLGQVRLAARGMRDHFVTRILGRPHAHAADASLSAGARALALRTTGDVIDGVTPNPRLRLALKAQWGFYGSPPHRSAFGVHALLCRHYRGGAFYPQGGSLSLARALTASLAAAGGWVQTATAVGRILVRHGRADGVTLATGEHVFARTIVSAVGAHNTVGLLPPEERAEEWTAAVRRLPPSCAHVCLNVGFRGDIRAAGATQANHWLFADDGMVPWDGSEREPSAYVAFPSLKDPLSRGEQGLHTAEVVALVDWAPFARWAGTPWRHRGDEYAALKARITRQLLAKLLRRFPALEPLVDHAELSTPLSAVHFVRAVDGAAYGVEPTPERLSTVWLRPRVPVSGLYLAGADVGVVGVMGALAGGVCAAIAAAPGPVTEWIRTAVRGR